jgi:hypothetical protein
MGPLPDAASGQSSKVTLRRLREVAWMRVIGAAAFCLAMLAVSGEAQQPLQSIRGMVRDSGGTLLPGAEVLVGSRRTSTNARGAFRIDSLRPGQYDITIRLIGFSAVRSRLTVAAAEPTVVEYTLVSAPRTLPVIVVEGRRTGIYGTVGDTAYRAAVGARVVLGGSRGGEVLTDSMGRFAFPNATGGSYMVRITFPGYTERRFLVELKAGEGKELAVMMMPTMKKQWTLDPVAITDLGQRLSVNLRREHLTPDDLERYTSLGLCDVPRIKLEVGRTTTLILNGMTVMRDFPVSSLCTWQADEVELVEFGPNICGDLTGTVAWILNVAPCLGKGRRSVVPRSIVPAGQQPRYSGGSYVIIWEKM